MAKFLQGRDEIYARLCFILPKEMFHAVNPFAGQKPFENFRALRREDFFRHPFVFHPDLVFVFLKLFGGAIRSRFRPTGVAL